MSETELMRVRTTIKKIERVSKQLTFQPLLVNVPLPSSAMSHSDSRQSSLQSFDRLLLRVRWNNKNNLLKSF